MSHLTRRDFLQGTASLAALAGAAMLGDSSAAQEPTSGQTPAPQGANERINVAVIGVRGRGREHIQGLAGQNNCIVTHICDVDRAPDIVGRAVTAVHQRQGSDPQVVQDLRRIMDDRSIHAVSIATPNHWHALAAIWAIQAGKDVYVEKPVSHNVSEGRRIVQFARQHNRICQAGTQIRSHSGIQQAINYVRSGELGRVLVARGLCYKPRGTIGRVGADGGTIPSTLDYNLWCGPAPRPDRLARRNLHYDWHWFWDYGNGDLGNQGIHQMDLARWGLGKNGLARSVVSVGGRFGYVDDGQTANTQLSVFDYGDCELIFEVRGLRTDPYRGAAIGDIFHCADGHVVVTSYTQAAAFRPNGERIRTFNGGGDHFRNFITAVRSRRWQDLNGDIEQGHISSALCHLANVSFRLGTATPFTRRNGIFGNDTHATETLNRTVEHLSANMVPLDNSNLQVGRRLTINPPTETFVNDREADGYLTRQYRQGFAVPARV